MDSDSVTMLSRHQVQREVQAGMLAALNIDLPGTERPIGLTTRARTSRPPRREPWRTRCATQPRNLAERASSARKNSTASMQNA